MAMQKMAHLDGECGTMRAIESNGLGMVRIVRSRVRDGTANHPIDDLKCEDSCPLAQHLENLSAHVSALCRVVVGLLGSACHTKLLHTTNASIKSSRVSLTEDNTNYKSHILCG